jgi:ATP-dependent helicase HrpB
LRYGTEKVTLAARVQEFFGMKSHPALLNETIPLTLEFLSPAMRPIQTTTDIAGFWNGSWRDVRSDLRGRYPKHFWPEDPANATPTRHTKARSGKLNES